MTSSSDSANNNHSALGHLRVLDLARLEGHYCGKLFADLGADVLKVEPPEGDPARYIGPFAGDTPDPERSLYFINFNTNKKSLTLDIASRSGRDDLLRLVSTADVLVESFTPGYLNGINLGFQALSAINPALVMTSITPFGQSGPYRDYLGSELIAQAMGGLMYIQGDDNKPPCVAPCDQVSQLSSIHAAYGTLVGLAHRNKSGRGQHVDVSMQEIVAHLLFTIPNYASSGRIVRRPGVASTLAPSSYYRCKDGYVCLAVVHRHHWKVLVEWMGVEALADPMWEDSDFRHANPDIIDQFVAEFVAGFTVSEFVEEGQRHHLSVCPLNTVEDFLDSPQIRDLEYFVTSSHPDIGDHPYPGAPYRFSETPWKVRRPAPRLGQHQQEILGDLETAPGAVKRKSRGSLKSATPELPLRGVRIVDFTRIWAGPLGTRYLADLGADVIKIETSRYLDSGRYSEYRRPMFPEINRSKLGITLDFQEPRGLDLARHLVGVSDVVIENFASGVMERRGLGYESLRKIKPDIIVVSMPGFGSTGSIAGHIGFGQNLMAYVGLSVLWGYPDSPLEARPKMHYVDFVSAAAASAAVMAALEYRSQTGRGQFIELAQVETLASTLGVPYLDKLVNGHGPQPAGNGSVSEAPHGCYPCRGDDQWCVISCATEEQWKSLCQVLGPPSWTGDPMFGSLRSRIEHRVELDDLISRWTSDHTPHEVMHLLQKAGVPAGVVQNGEQLYRDHHLRSRNFIVETEHPGRGVVEHTGLTVGLSESPGRIVRGLPELGEHNEYTFLELLGTNREDFARMVADKVID